MSRFVSPQKLLVGVAIVSSLGIGYALGAQPHMDAALALLQNARAELEPSPSRTRAAIARKRSLWWIRRSAKRAPVSLLRGDRRAFA